VRFLSAVETLEAKLLAQASGLTVRQLPDEPDSQWEMQMLTAMVTAPEAMSILGRETAKDSA
jgi:hypothetical protein